MVIEYNENKSIKELKIKQEHALANLYIHYVEMMNMLWVDNLLKQSDEHNGQ